MHDDTRACLEATYLLRRHARDRSLWAALLDRAARR
jgi:hypothetical protein